jgi:hypothetical protein
VDPAINIGDVSCKEEPSTNTQVDGGSQKPCARGNQHGAAGGDENVGITQALDLGTEALDPK